MRKCKDCPIKGTKYCHLVNPEAPKYTLSEKQAIKRAISGELNQKKEG